MENNLKKQRPQSSISQHHLPNLTHRKSKVSYPKITSTRDINRNDYNPHKVFIPKLESENIYKNNIDLKQTINDLNKKIDFLKANNQKLSLIISKKDKEIDELTNQVILKNKELVTKEKKERQKEKGNADKGNTPNKNDKKNINKVNNFEKDLQLKKLYNEISLVKEKYNKAIIEIRNKEEEILNLRRNKNLTDYNELRIRNEVLTQEFDKLREMYLLSLDMNKKNENFGRNENILKAEIQTQHDIITELKSEIDLFSLERKQMNDTITDLKNKLELAYNNSKFMKNEKNKIEKKYKKNIKEQVLQKENEEEKQQMTTKINKLEEKLRHYMLIATKNNNYGTNSNNKEEKFQSKNNKNKNDNDGTSAIIISGGKKNGITTRTVHPEENYDSKTLLMQSIITELTNEKKELLDKIKMYEEQINQTKIDNNSNNNNLNKESNLSSQPQNNINNSSNLLKTTEEILIADNNQNKIPNDNNQNQISNDNNQNQISNDNNQNQISNEVNQSQIPNDNNQSQIPNDNNQNQIPNDNNQNQILNDDDKKKEVENENTSKEEIKFDDILSLNFEYNNINSTNAKDLFNPIFSQFENEDKNSDTYKESILSSLVNEISLKLNCNTKEDEKKEIHQNIQLLIEQDENLEDNFYILFDDVINHNEEARKTKDNEYESIIKEKFMEENNKSSIEEIINNNENKIRIDHFYDILYEKNIKLEKKVFLYLCYKLKTKDCNSLYDIETKDLSNYIN